ncbi:MULTISPECIES: AzlD domain-containing protein [Raoultella]|jgi:branched-subunit amino acid transport protein|uniref:AzlD domain-containing protein n=2 Tax=Raoultella TaxID=160674 RepID=A0A1V2BI07_RAOTE|nr:MULTISPECIES: AzlD domain-containing protein [Raoultella]TCQ73848.1 branched-subunit amino acid transport protein [Raoultella ornithinolytica]MCE9897280.1 AzlD domain-containing protein [Raoultella terrigena]MCI1033590.1 AzlD domain-containing protein [Raoultella terrigena]MCS4273463.1 branched-subunit amino acid transport protein [Raoultella sp. BIGb0132]MCS4290092.1 branched-subunit amino acid transport protein [Raoultella terrigena]
MERNIILAILASALVTALMRTVPVLLLSRFRLAPVIQQWLSFIPSAIMAAIIAAELLGKPALSGSGISISLLAAAAATVAGALTRSLFATVIAGMVAFSALSYLLL